MTRTAGAVLMLFVSLFISIVLSLVIGHRGIRRYVETREQGILLLTIGIVLLSGAPIGIDVVLVTATALPGPAIAAFVDLIRLVGLVVILVTIYDT